MQKMVQFVGRAAWLVQPVLVQVRKVLIANLVRLATLTPMLLGSIAQFVLGTVPVAQDFSQISVPHARKGRFCH
jgi:hypothetical protein